MQFHERYRWIGFGVSVAVCFGAAALGSLATMSEINGWYSTLTKPAWNPPNYIFGPVWTTLYLMMAIAAWLTWQHSGWRTARIPLVLFAIQLALNVGWSWVFFGMHQIGPAFAEILVLWTAILATTIAFFRVQRLAGVLMIPYLAWVSFAGFLNFTIWQMN